eukprot:Polyplicarium_translucidae@DN3557_c0_g1_i1.p2
MNGSGHVHVGKAEREPGSISGVSEFERGALVPAVSARTSGCHDPSSRLKYSAVVFATQDRCEKGNAAMARCRRAGAAEEAGGRGTTDVRGPKMHRRAVSR